MLWFNILWSFFYMYINLYKIKLNLCVNSFSSITQLFAPSMISYYCSLSIFKHSHPHQYNHTTSIAWEYAISKFCWLIDVRYSVCKCMNIFFCLVFVVFVVIIPIQLRWKNKQTFRHSINFKNVNYTLYCCFCINNDLFCCAEFCWLEYCALMDEKFEIRNM